MTRMVLVLVLICSLVGSVEAVDLNKEFMEWSANQRAGYIMGAIDATNDWMGLTCPGDVSYAVLILYMQQFAERKPGGKIMESFGLALAEAKCNVGDGTPASPPKPVTPPSKKSKTTL